MLKVKQVSKIYEGKIAYRALTDINLTIDEDLLKKVKLYADKNNESISNLVEEYFETIVKKPKQKLR